MECAGERVHVLSTHFHSRFDVTSVFWGRGHNHMAISKFHEDSLCLPTTLSNATALPVLRHALESFLGCETTA